MNSQLELPIVQPQYTPEMTLQQRFELFHQTNPHVYTKLCQLADDLLAKGQKHFGIKLLYEVLRWHHLMKTNDPTSGFKLSNSYTSRYARLMVVESRFKTVFKMKKLRAQ